MVLAGYEGVAMCVWINAAMVDGCISAGKPELVEQFVRCFGCE